MWCRLDQLIASSASYSAMVIVVLPSVGDTSARVGVRGRRLLFLRQPVDAHLAATRAGRREVCEPRADLVADDLADAHPPHPRDLALIEPRLSAERARVIDPLHLAPLDDGDVQNRG